MEHLVDEKNYRDFQSFDWTDWTDGSVNRVINEIQACVFYLRALEEVSK
jgi:hypothetical protein